jgi:bacteriorhodopsin
MNIDTSSRREQRNFGLVMAGAIVVVTLIHGAIRGSLAPWPFYIAGAFLVLGLVAPIVLKPVLVVWIQFALLLNWIVTRVLLTLVWVLMFIPFRIVLSALGKDPLNRRRLPGAPTYWEPAEDQPADPKRYFNQY